MSVFDLLRNNRKKEKQEKSFINFFNMLQGYTPVFTSFEGGVYEQALTRSCIHCFATHCSKLKPEITGTTPTEKAWEKQLQFKMNPLQNTSQYLYNLATMYQIYNNAFIAPVYKNDVLDVAGFFPVIPMNVELITYQGEFYYKYSLQQGTYIIEANRAGMLSQYLNKNPVFGESNKALMPTIELLDTNRQGIIEGVKNSANIRFLAKMAGVYADDDIDTHRKNLREKNLNPENNNGVFTFDSAYESVQAIKSEQFVINAAQQREIEDSVFSYFGENKKILQNDFTSSEWDSYYEGKIEPFAIQASLAHTNVKYTEREISFGNSILFTANRLQHMEPDKKIQVFQTLFDRGAMTANQGAEMFNMKADLPNGDKYYIRGEYIDQAKVVEQAKEVTNE